MTSKNNLRFKILYTDYIKQFGGLEYHEYTPWNFMVVDRSSSPDDQLSDLWIRIGEAQAETDSNGNKLGYKFTIKKIAWENLSGSGLYKDNEQSIETYETNKDISNEIKHVFYNDKSQFPSNGRPDAILLATYLKSIPEHTNTEAKNPKAEVPVVKSIAPVEEEVKKLVFSQEAIEKAGLIPPDDSSEHRELKERVSNVLNSVKNKNPSTETVTIENNNVQNSEFDPTKSPLGMVGGSYQPIHEMGESDGNKSQLEFHPITQSSNLTSQQQVHSITKSHNSTQLEFHPITQSHTSTQLGVHPITQSDTSTQLNVHPITQGNNSTQSNSNLPPVSVVQQNPQIHTNLPTVSQGSQVQQPHTNLPTVSQGSQVQQPHTNLIVSQGSQVKQPHPNLPTVSQGSQVHTDSGTKSSEFDPKESPLKGGFSMLKSTLPCSVLLNGAPDYSNKLKKNYKDFCDCHNNLTDSFSVKMAYCFCKTAFPAYLPSFTSNLCDSQKGGSQETEKILELIYNFEELIKEILD